MNRENWGCRVNCDANCRISAGCRSSYSIGLLHGGAIASHDEVKTISGNTKSKEINFRNIFLDSECKNRFVRLDVWNFESSKGNFVAGPDLHTISSVPRVGAW